MHVCFYVDLGMIARVLRRSRFIHVVFSAGCLIARAAYGHRCLYVKLGMSVCVLRRSLEKLWKSCGKAVEKLWKSCGKAVPVVPSRFLGF